MTNEITTAQPAPFKPSALAVMASRFSVEPAKLLNTLKNTVFKNATDDELLALVVVANEYGLNPLTKEIYAFPAKGGGIVPVVSVDGWNNMANSHSQMDGMDFEFEHDDNGQLVSCTCIIYRKDRSRPIRVTEYLSECKRNTDPWKMEHRMLRHKALIQCSRVAFGFSGIVDEDEAPVVRDVTPVKEAVIPAAKVKEDKPKRAVKEASAQTLQEQLADRVNDSGFAWETIVTAAQEGGIFAHNIDNPEQQPDDVCKDMLAVWDALIANLKGAEA